MEKKERFKRIASSRVDSILVKLDSLSKCANKYNYDYEVSDVDKMFKEIKLAVSNTEKCFRIVLDSKKGKFKFD